MQQVLRAVLFGLAFTPTASFASEITIGRWCDVILRSAGLTQTIEIAGLSDGSIVARRSFSDGSAGKSDLEELGAETYAVIDAAYGEKYRIVPSTGDLQLLDEDGLIRTARRLENTPQDGECK